MQCRRSRRASLVDHLLSALRMLPWKCRDCSHRFHAWMVPVTFLLRVHCPSCGNPAVNRVSRDRVDKVFLAGLQRMMRVPAYRCDNCRQKFFSLRSYLPANPVASVANHQAKPGRSRAGHEPSA